MPVYKHGNHGLAYEIDTVAFFEWQSAPSQGISVEQYRQAELENEVRLRVREEARWAVIENKTLAETVRQLTAEVAALQRKVEAKPGKRNSGNG